MITEQIYRVGWWLLAKLVDNDQRLRRMIADRLAWAEQRRELARMVDADQALYYERAQKIIDRHIPGPQWSRRGPVSFADGITAHLYTSKEQPDD